MITLTEEFKSALYLLECSNNSYYLDGEAGSGKTTLINHWTSISNKRIVKLAPTGAAAVQCGGQTIHSFFRFTLGIISPDKIRFKQPVAEILDCTDTIILDEASMIRADLMDGIDESLRIHCDMNKPFGGKQVILVGDLYQLSPVVSKDIESYFDSIYKTPFFFSANCYKDANVEYMKLTHVFRQSDQEYIRVLNKIRNGTASGMDLMMVNDRFKTPNLEEKYMYISSVNRKVDKINEMKLAQINGDPIIFNAEVFGEFSKKLYPAPENLAIKIGARVTTLVNDFSSGYVNGSMGEITGFSDNITSEEDEYPLIKVKLDNGIHINVPRVEWKVFTYTYENGTLEKTTLGTFTQYPIALGFARSIHKSQGSTYREKIVINFEGWFPPGLVYVALSRATELSNIYLSQPIYPRNIAVNPRISQFLGKLVNKLHDQEVIEISSGYKFE
jgi:ATP-dependent DNA helicase PIF1